MKKKLPKRRNPYALPAKMRKSGRHKDKKKEGDKKACRRTPSEDE